jgi:hypothetical protein
MKLLIAFLLFIGTMPAILPAGLTSKDLSNEQTWKEFNQAVNKKTEEIKSLMFWQLIRIAGILGIGYAVIMLCMVKIQTMITWGGIGILLNIIPYFIDSVFGALLPRM